MQHYRTPTRLLDWTTSVLIALHFAVSGDAGLDGEIWAMYPIALNERAGIGSGFPMLGQNILLEFLIQQPYWAASPEKLAARLEMAAVPKRPIAFQPPVSFRRMLGQLSKFTIHPPPAPGNTIPDILMKPEYLVRYIVPARYKNRLRNQLAVLGVADFVLFPDLEGLSRHLVESHKVLTYSVPEPPECSGPWDGSAD